MFCYTDKVITGYLLVTALVLNPEIISISFAQTVNAHTSENHNNRKHKVNADYPLRNGISVKRALETISRKENLILSYDSDLLESTDKISVQENYNHHSVDKVLQEILSETELEYKILKTRHLVIYDRGKVGRVVGKVVDSNTLNYLTGAKMQLKKADADSAEKDIEKVTYVDSTGRYEINNVEEGAYELIVTMEDYKQVSKTIEIRNKQTVQFIELERNK